jgi:hypothetical protein
MRPKAIGFPRPGLWKNLWKTVWIAPKNIQILLLPTVNRFWYTGQTLIFQLQVRPNRPAELAQSW